MMAFNLELKSQWYRGGAGNVPCRVRGASQLVQRLFSPEIKAYRFRMTGWRMDLLFRNSSRPFTPGGV